MNDTPPPLRDRHGRRPGHAHALGDAQAPPSAPRPAAGRLGARGPAELALTRSSSSRPRDARRLRRRRRASSCRRAPRHRRRRRIGAGGARRLRRRRARALRRHAAHHRRAPAEASSTSTLGAPTPPCSSFVPTRPAPTAASCGGSDGSARDRRGVGRVRPSELAIRELNSSIYVFDAARLWQALERIEPHNAQGELYLTDCVGHIVEAAAARPRRRGGPGRAALGVNTRVELAIAAAGSGTASTSSTCSPA